MKRKFEIYRLCRDNEVIEKLKSDQKEYDLPMQKFVTGIDFHEFIRKILKECESDYCLVVHDDVYLPETIEENILTAIRKANDYVGRERWGIIGNCGMEFLSRKPIRFIKDPHSKSIPFKNAKPLFAETIDGNTFLLNIKNLKRKGFTYPEDLKGFHFYDIILSLQTYLVDLVVLIDHNLYVVHQSKGDQYNFNKAKYNDQIQNYFRKRFLNSSYLTLNGLIEIDNNYDELDDPINSEKRVDINDLFVDVVNRIDFRRKKISFLLRLILNDLHKFERTLESIYIFQSLNGKYVDSEALVVIDNYQDPEKLKDLQKILGHYPDLNIRVKDINNEPMLNKYSRVKALNYLVSELEDTDEHYAMIVDQDDFVFPHYGRYLPMMLDKDKIVIGDVAVFNEEWGEGSPIPLKSKLFFRKDGGEYFKSLTSENYVMICAPIYPVGVLKDVFIENKLEGDYFEDYVLYLYASKKAVSHHYPFLFSGVSYHGENTVLVKDRSKWDYSYATFFSELVNNEYMEKNMVELLDNARFLDEDKYQEYELIIKSRYWKLVKLLLKVRFFVHRIFTRIINIFK